MQPEPLQVATIPPFLETLSVSQVALPLFGLVFLVWALYTVVAAYHWFRYGQNSTLAIPSLMLHALVSLGLIGYAASGLPL